MGIISRTLGLVLLLAVAACAARGDGARDHRATGPYMSGGAGYGMP